MQELIDFLDEQHTAITEYSETLTRRLVENNSLYSCKYISGDFEQQYEATIMLFGIYQALVRHKLTPF